MQKKLQYKRIVVFRPGQFGDTVVTFPALEYLREVYPNAEIVYVCNYFRSGKYVQGTDVAKLSACVDDIKSYYMEDSLLGKYKTLKNGLELSNEDLLIYLPYNIATYKQVLRDWIFFKFIGMKNHIGFLAAIKWDLYNRKQDLLPKESERILKTISAKNERLEILSCKIRFDSDCLNEQWGKWNLHGKQVMAMCAGTKMQCKRWPIEKYIEIGRWWLKNKNTEIVLIGGSEDAKEAQLILDHWEGKGFSASGYSLDQTAAILSGCNLYCGNDTGSMHLAAIQNIPCVALFSRREKPKVWHPYGEKNVVLDCGEIECQYCGLETCNSNPAPCMERITVENVRQAISKLSNEN